MDALLNKLRPNNPYIPLLAVSVLVGLVVWSIVKNNNKNEGFDNTVSPDMTSNSFSELDRGDNLQDNQKESGNSLDSFFATNVQNAESEYSEKTNNESNTKTELNATDFLPQELNVNWFDKDFNTVNEIDQETLIDISKYSSGIDTVGQSLKNPSYDIRGNIANPKNIISPFLNSSIEPDNNIRPIFS